MLLYCRLLLPVVYVANSPDLNPVDYCIWGMMQERVYRILIRDTDDLRQRLVVTWAEFQQSVVDDATDQWRRRLEAYMSIRRRWSL